MDSFRAVVDLWETPDALAIEVGAKVETARKWRQRDSIPAEWWRAVMQTKIARSNGVTFERLALLAARHTEAAE